MKLFILLKFLILQMSLKWASELLIASIVGRPNNFKKSVLSIFDIEIKKVCQMRGYQVDPLMAETLVEMPIHTKLWMQSFPPKKI